MPNINNLKDFIIAAENSRKYSANTGSSYRTALKYFEAELKEDEKESLELFQQHFDAIYQNVYNKYKTKMSSASLEIYKRRVRNLIEDFNKYGSDPAKLSSWSRLTRVHKPRKQKEHKLEQSFQSQEVDDESVPMAKFELPLRINAKATIITPTDMTRSEAKKLKNYIEYLESNISQSEENSVSASENE